MDIQSAAVYNSGRMVSKPTTAVPYQAEMSRPPRHNPRGPHSHDARPAREAPRSSSRTKTQHRARERPRVSRRLFQAARSQGLTPRALPSRCLPAPGGTRPAPWRRIRAPGSRRAGRRSTRTSRPPGRARAPRAGHRPTRCRAPRRGGS